jgi:hypothetical protein
MAEIHFKLSKSEADALMQTNWSHRKSKMRESAESKMRDAIFTTFPELREVDKKRAAKEAKEEARAKAFTDSVLRPRAKDL